MAKRRTTPEPEPVAAEEPQAASGAEPIEPEPEPVAELVTISLAERAPFRAVDLPGCTPSIVLQRGESATVPAEVADHLRRAVRAGAIDTRVVAYLTIT